MRSVLLAATVLALASPAHAQSISDIFRKVEGAVGSLANASSSAGSRTAGPAYDIETFNVAGIRMGMTPEEAEAALTERGFQTNFKTVEYTVFSDGVRDEARKLKQPMPELAAQEGRLGSFAQDSKGNSVGVEFIHLMEGPRVAGVRLTFDKNTNDYNTLPDDVISSYGTPTIDKRDLLDVFWCSNRGAKCEAEYLHYYLFGEHTLKLSDGGERYNLRQAQIAALFDAPTSDRQRSLLVN